MITALKTTTNNKVNSKIASKVCNCHEEAEAKFLELMPAIKLMARTAFQDFKADKREDAIQSVLVTSYINIVQLAQRGRLDKAFSTPIGLYAIKAYRSGRVGGVSMNSTDVLGESTQARGRTKVESYDAITTQNDWGEMFLYDTRVNVVRDVSFKIDYEVWIETLNDRHRQMLDCMIDGDTTGELAAKFKISPARVSQIRHELVDSWKKFMTPVDDQDKDRDN